MHYPPEYSPPADPLISPIRNVLGSSPWVPGQVLQHFALGYSDGLKSSSRRCAAMLCTSGKGSLILLAELQAP